MAGRDLLAAATPRPWNGDDQLDIYAADGSAVGSVEWRDNDSDSANTALIVAAVNEYEALLDAEHYLRTLVGGERDTTMLLLASDALARLDAVRSGT